MIQLKIDQQEIEVSPGTTLLAATRQMGLDIPALCSRDGCDPENACMLCLVKLTDTGRLVPACSTQAAHGMEVESETDEVLEVRRAGLELLLSDHLGDCAAPCQNTCPAHMDIPRMLSQIAAGQLAEAIATVKRDIALPAVLGRVCPEVCERACRRDAVDSSAAICQLERHVADVDLATESPYLPPCATPSGKRVAIVGSGPTGLAAAYHLLQAGHACTVLERRNLPGGSLSEYVDGGQLPTAVLAAEIALIEQLGATFQLATTVGQEFTVDSLLHTFDVVLLAVGKFDLANQETLDLPDLQKGASKAPDRLPIDPHTSQLILSNSWDTRSLFAAGKAVRPNRLTIKSIAAGKEVAERIDCFLRGRPMTGWQRRFAVHIGRMQSCEIGQLMTGVPGTDRIVPATGPKIGLNDEQARQEAQRCLHCDCGNQEGCLLRNYADTLDANPNRFRGERRLFKRQLQPGKVVFEPGKCILCGLCVQIANRAKEPLGLTYIGRGFNVQIAAPFNHSLDQGLQQTARECAEACPTGALALRTECGLAGSGCAGCGRQ
jgi:NADPH-dependent glutamate synthase beta subunit-like oxidoreductase/ferredoxin